MSEILDHVFVKIRSALEKGHETRAVFDLDSTLFDVAPRLEKVLMDFAEVPENRERFPEHIPFFQNVKAHRTDWGIKKTLIRAGLTHAEPEFQAAVRDFWREKFFSNDYLEFDVPYDGAVQYVQQLYQMGCKISYLTGRDVFRMGEGSLRVLKKWGFPIDVPSSELVLKPVRGMDDGLFKRDWFLQYPPKEGQEIWFFENEPVNVNLVLKHSPHVQIVFFDSTHQGAEHPPEHIPKIMNFLCGIDPRDSSRKGDV